VSTALFANLSLQAQQTPVTELQYTIKIIPAQYETVYETIEVAPALNADMDTENYFAQTEVIEVAPEGKEWVAQESADGTALTLTKTPAKHQTIEKRFYPFKNILDVSNAENVVAAQYITIERKVQVSPARVEYCITAPYKQFNNTFSSISADEQTSIQFKGTTTISHL
jgi:hypothetical protein